MYTLCVCIYRIIYYMHDQYHIQYDYHIYIYTYLKLLYFIATIVTIFPEVLWAEDPITEGLWDLSGTQATTWMCQLLLWQARSALGRLTNHVQSVQWSMQRFGFWIVRMGLCLTLASPVMSQGREGKWSHWKRPVCLFKSAYPPTCEI